MTSDRKNLRILKRNLVGLLGSRKIVTKSQLEQGFVNAGLVEDIEFVPNILLVYRTDTRDPFSFDKKGVPYGLFVSLGIRKDETSKEERYIIERHFRRPFF